MNASLVLTANAGQAKAELRAVKSETAALKGETQALAGAAKTVEVAETRAIRTLKALTGSGRTAAGSMGNLVSQFNDVGMMMAAGQNPLQLAIQQGSQIAQVIGPMGATGAVKALGGAFLGMLNPVNLAVMAAVAAGAAMVQWLTSGREAALSAADAIERLEKKTGDYVSAAKAATASNREMAESYGAMAGQAREALQAAADLQRVQATQTVGGSIKAVMDELIVSRSQAVGRGTKVTRELAEDFGLAKTAAEDLRNSLLALENAKGLQAQADAALVVQRSLEAAFGPVSSEWPAAMQDVYAEMSKVAVEAGKVEGSTAAIARARIADMLREAVGPASALSGILEKAAGWWADLKSTAAIANWNRDSQASSLTYGGRGSDPRDFLPGGKGAGKPFVYDGPSLNANNEISDSAGAGAAREERDAVAELVRKLEEERDVLLTIDPVKREMLQYRKELAQATDQEKAKVEELIRVEMQLNAAREMAKTFESMTESFLDAVIVKGEKAGTVIRRLAADFLAMAARGFLTGQGPVAGMLGIKGGLFSGLFRAEGGMVYGGGGPRDDKVPLWGSAGEFMVNARATRRYRGLLEMINGGADLPGFAQGGMIGRAAAVPLAAAGRPEPAVIHININGARGDAEIREVAAEGVKLGLQHFNREVLPGRVQAILKEPRVR